MKVTAIIPARYASSRFPGKPLAQILGKPMIQWVYEKTSLCRSIDDVIVATDDERIEAVVRQFNGNVVMTSTDHASGTDRIAEVVSRENLDSDVIINVQGDEPGIRPEQLDELVAVFKEGIEIATLVTPVRDYEQMLDTDIVKAICTAEGKCLYFSRSPVPYDRNNLQHISHCYQHIGVYAYRKEVLLALAKLKPSALEKKESLEQLRWLEAGYSVHYASVAEALIGVDRPEDLAEAEELLRGTV